MLEGANRHDYAAREKQRREAKRVSVKRRIWGNPKEIIISWNVL